MDPPPLPSPPLPSHTQKRGKKKEQKTINKSQQKIRTGSSREHQHQRTDPSTQLAHALCIIIPPTHITRQLPARHPSQQKLRMNQKNVTTTGKNNHRQSQCCTSDMNTPTAKSHHPLRSHVCFAFLAERNGRREPLRANVRTELEISSSLPTSGASSSDNENIRDSPIPTKPAT
jgi:hypothetical protein